MHKIGEFVSKLKGVTYVSILPYHTVAKGKHERWHMAALDRISDPVFDQRAKLIRSSYRDGAARYGSEVYKFRKGRLRLVESTDVKYIAQKDQLFKVTTKKKLVNGRMKDVRVVKTPSHE